MSLLFSSYQIYSLERSATTLCKFSTYESLNLKTDSFLMVRVNILNFWETNECKNVDGIDN